MKKEGDNSFGVSSVILGIIGIVGALNFPPLIFGICSPLAIIFGLVQRRHDKNKWALWGIILGVLGIIANIFSLIVLLKFVEELAQKMIAAGYTNGA